MRLLVVLGAVLLSAVPSDETPCDTAPAPAVGYREETLVTEKNDSSAENIQSKTESNEKVRVKHLKGGGTKIVKVDSSRTKIKKDLMSDEHSQSTHKLTEDGLEDSTCLTRDKQHHVKEVDTVKKKDKEVIIKDKYGNVISDTKKEKVKEKTKTKVKDKETQSLVHTVKHVPPPADTEEHGPPPADTEEHGPPPADTEEHGPPPADTEDAPPAPDC